jgi:hypothetical protein
MSDYGATLGTRGDAKLQRLPSKMLGDLRKWLTHQAASNYLSYDPASGGFDLSPEQSMVFADLDQPWIPVLEHAVAKPEGGAEVTDVGCGDGWCTGIVANALDFGRSAVPLPERRRGRGPQPVSVVGAHCAPPLLGKIS